MLTLIGRYRSQIMTAALGLGLLASYWPAIWRAAERWAEDEQYSHGYLVPIFAAYLLWQRRQDMRETLVEGQGSWWGIGVLALAGVLQFSADFFFFSALEPCAVLLACAGLVLLAGGWKALRIAALPIGFLVFMFPLPFRLQVMLARPLQQLATAASLYFLETLGFAVLSEGNVLRLGVEARIGVAEACNGLSMLVTFFALSSAVAALARTTWVERSLIVLSAAPIALAANVLRIVVTGLLYQWVGDEAAGVFFHDLAGWFMMPVALGMLGIELALMKRIVVDAAAETAAVPRFFKAMAPVLR